MIFGTSTQFCDAQFCKADWQEFCLDLLTFVQLTKILKIIPVAKS